MCKITSYICALKIYYVFKTLWDMQIYHKIHAIDLFLPNNTKCSNFRTKEWA